MANSWSQESANDKTKCAVRSYIDILFQRSESSTENDEKAIANFVLAQKQPVTKWLPGQQRSD